MARHHSGRPMEKTESGKSYSRANREKNSMDPRRLQEMKDAGMIQEDHSATANLPQMVKYHDWPKADHYTDYGLDDTIKGIDKQENEDERGMKRHMQRGKY